MLDVTYIENRVALVVLISQEHGISFYIEEIENIYKRKRDIKLQE